MPGRVVNAALALALLMVACNTKVDPVDPASELAGDGSRAYFKLASVWCARAAECLEETNYGPRWVSTEACAEREAYRFSVHGQNECAPDTDFDADAEELAACLKALREERCASTLSSTHLMLKARTGALPQCRALVEHLGEAEDERAGALPLGTSCTSGTRCTWDAYCDRKEGESCGVCRAYPGDGAECLIGEEGDSYCSAGLRCDSGICRGLPSEGERCSDLGTCANGLDCNGAGVCSTPFQPGDACDADFAYSCGDGLVCTDGQCSTGNSLATGQIGQSCAGEGAFCLGGRCVDGKCAPLPGLGEACSADCVDGCNDECLLPYVCLKGKCSEVPACNTGKLEAACTASDQCGPNLGCIHNSDGPSHCGPIPAELGQPCTEAEGCYDGICLKGVCTRGEGGEPCENYRDCRSRVCDYEVGRCTEATVCE